MRKTLALRIAVASLLVPTLCRANAGGDSLEQLSAAIQSADWRAAAATCAKLTDSESRAAGRADYPASRYAVLAARCAASAAATGDSPASEWWWYTALAMDAHAATAEAAHLATAPAFHPEAPRSPTPPDAQLAATQVRLADGSVAMGTVAHRLGPAKPPHYMFEPIPGVAGYSVDVEAILGADGLLRQPLLVSAHALPLQAFLTFASLRDWRYEPSRVDDRPVATRVAIHLASASTASSQPRPQR
jgi:hypothetical protein